MKFKSALVTQVSGSIGGMTGSHNRGGLYFRSRTIPTDPATAFQIAVRSFMISAVARWSSLLTGVQRDNWEIYASLVTIKGPLGDPITLSGFNMFVRTNVVCLQNGLPVSADAPTIFNLGDSGEVSFTVAALLDNISVVFDNTQEWAIIDDGALTIAVSRPQNPTINFFKGPFRKINPVLGNTAVPPVSPFAQQGPFTMTAGQRVWLKVRAVTPDGRLSPAKILGPIVVT